MPQDKEIAADLEMLSQGILPKHDRYLPAYYDKPANILSYLSENDLLFLFDYHEIIQNINSFSFRISEEIKTLAETGYRFLQKDYFFNKEQVLSAVGKPLIFEKMCIRDRI